MDPEIKNTSEYKELSLEQTSILLKSTPAGLSVAEVNRRLQEFGYNAITEKKRNYLLDFLRRFWSPMPWLLELAMGLSFLLGHYFEGIIIFVLLAVNALIGQLHANTSQKALELLKNRLALKAKVLRDGKWVLEEARNIVPGDVIAVRLGDIVPADAKVISGELLIDQSALTGESLPLEAHQSGIIYSGSVIKRGEAKCIVVNTGSNTYFGRTAELVKTAKPKSHQEEVMISVVKYMMYLGIAASILVSIYALFMRMDILLILTFIMIFLMGAVPVALPAVLTIVQSVGAMELSREGVLVTRLDSIEDAASIDILCLDKTGTITQNKLSIVDSVSFSQYQMKDIAAIAAFASQEEGMDAIDLAAIEYAKAIGYDFKEYKQVSYTPFNPSSKRTEAIVEYGTSRFRAVKGAVQIVLGMCSKIDATAIKQIDTAINKYSEKGYRIIAVARSEGSDLDNLHFAGLLLLADKPRPEAKGMIEEARELGIKPIMLTGDNVSIAQEIAREVGIGDKIIRLSDIRSFSEDAQVKIVAESNGFAEVYPEDKYKIVKLLQSRRHMVGMTGDGVNDAPALRQAEMGIAVDNSTDVAKASASVVLTEPGVAVIIDTIKISRQTYQRMLTWVINKVTKVIEFVGLLTVSFFWLHNIVLSLLGMSLLVFANDFVTMSLATDRVRSTSNPNEWNVKNITLSSLIPGMLLVIEGLIVILIGMRYFHLGWDKLQALVMLNLVFNSQLRVLIVRERRHFWSSMPGKGLVLSSTVTIIGFVLLCAFGIFVPLLSVEQIFVVLLFSVLFTLSIDFPKYYLFRKFKL